jgi:hypothetical protein
MQNLLGKCEGDTLLRRTRSGLENNINMNLKEIRRKDVNWIQMTRDRI